MSNVRECPQCGSLFQCNPLVKSRIVCPHCRETLLAEEGELIVAPVSCPSCGAENPPHATICGGCAVALSLDD